MRHSRADTPVSIEDVLDAAERVMRENLLQARLCFMSAKRVVDDLDLDPEAQARLWGKFNATERRLMKDKDGVEWSSGS